MQKSGKTAIILFVLLLIIGVVLFAPMMHHWRLMGDYPVHDELALSLIQNPTEFFRNTPHFLYHVLTALMYLLVPGEDVYVAGARVMVLSYLALMALIFWIARRSYTHVEHPARRYIIIIGSVIGLMLAVPISFVTPDNLYLGYFFSHVYHNPTVTLMKPFALALFWFALPLFSTQSRISPRWIPAYALLTALTLVAKPNFILSFVPALGFVTLYFLIADLRRCWQTETGSFFSRIWCVLTRGRINWAVLIGGIVVPALAILVIQALTWTSSGGISIQPFRVFFEWTLHYDPNADKNLLLKLLMSIAFPLTVMILYTRSALRSLLLNLAWVNFIISAAYAYLVVDQTIIAAGDFGWSAQVAVLLLYISTTIFLFQQHSTAWQRSDKIRLAISLAILALHIVSGIYWYALHLTGDAIELLYGVW